MALGKLAEAALTEAPLGAGAPLEAVLDPAEAGEGLAVAEAAPSEGAAPDWMDDELELAAALDAVGGTRDEDAAVPPQAASKAVRSSAIAAARDCLIMHVAAVAEAKSLDAVKLWAS